jgi:hypothetical protein
VNARLDDKYIEDTPEEKILLDGSIYDRMVVELTNKTIVNLTSRLALPSSVSAYNRNEENKEGSLPSPNYNQDKSNQSEIDNQKYQS